MNGNMPSNHIACRIFASAMMFGILTALTTPSTTAVEPNAEVASAWRRHQLPVLSRHRAVVSRLRRPEACRP